MVLIGVCAVALGACSSGGDSSSPATTTQHRTLVVNDEATPVCLAVANTVAEQVAGLANRPTLPPKEGMAFPAAAAQVESFNMKDTAFPLEIVWVGPGGQYLDATSMAPDTPGPYTSPAPITLAVELSPQDWGPLAGKARTISLGTVCDGTLTAGRPGKKPSQF
jgi:uncharacterized membrane protein (UPF0127 family)